MTGVIIYIKYLASKTTATSMTYFVVQVFHILNEIYTMLYRSEMHILMTGFLSVIFVLLFVIDFYLVVFIVGLRH